MLLDNKCAILEAILFKSPKGADKKELKEFFNTDNKELNKWIKNLQETYNKDNHGIMIRESKDKIEMVTKQEYSSEIKEFFNIKQQSKLSLASIETLSIIAYNEKVTIAEISAIRGVNSTGPVKNLLGKKLIISKGRKEVPGRPIEYGVSKEFFRFLGIKSKQDLPTIEELMELYGDDKEFNIIDNL